ncbi:MAG: hypothetical protein FWG09_05610 [Synergistaceae bacterium]|nr:hypothetical protein [Synergistaceae bacterium]
MAAIEKSLLKKFFGGLYLHRRRAETSQRVAETRQFMAEHADDWSSLNPPRLRLQSEASVSFYKRN